MSVVRPYADFAEIYLAAGLRVFPTGGPEGKKPCIKNWNRIGIPGARKLIGRFPDANIAVRCGGRGRLTRIDIDDPSLTDLAIDRFGDTPIKVGTPSGGVHLWYRSNGERRQIRLDGLKIDVLGESGYGLVPPSVIPQKGVYSFLEGDLDLLGKLPIIRPGALSQGTVEAPKGLQSPVSPKSLPEMREGDGRNNALFRIALSTARDAETIEVLLELLAEDNKAFAESLPSAEVAKIAGSAWRCKMEDRLFVPGCEAQVQFSGSEIKAFASNGDAFLLLGRLLAVHGGADGEPFALANAMAASFPWGLSRFRKARRFLETSGRIECVSSGGKGPHDPPYYRLPKR